MQRRVGPRWKLPYRVARMWTGLLVELFVSGIFDIWVRFLILPWHRRGSPGRIAAMNRVIRRWGVISNHQSSCRRTVEHPASRGEADPDRTEQHAAQPDPL